VGRGAVVGPGPPLEEGRRAAPVNTRLMAAGKCWMMDLTQSMGAGPREPGAAYGGRRPTPALQRPEPEKKRTTVRPKSSEPEKPAGHDGNTLLMTEDMGWVCCWEWDCWGGVVCEKTTPYGEGARRSGFFMAPPAGVQKFGVERGGLAGDRRGDRFGPSPAHYSRRGGGEPGCLFTFAMPTTTGANQGVARAVPVNKLPGRGQGRDARRHRWNRKDGWSRATESGDVQTAAFAAGGGFSGMVICGLYTGRGMGRRKLSVELRPPRVTDPPGRWFG